MVQSMKHQHVDFLHVFGGQNKNHATEIQPQIIAFRNGLEAPFETLVVQLHNTPTRLVHLHDKIVQLVQICSLFSSRDLGLDSSNNSCKWKLIEFYGFRIGQELQETWVTTISKQPAMLAYFGRLSKVAGVCLLALMGSHCCVGTPLHMQARGVFSTPRTSQMRPQKWSQRCFTIYFFKPPQLPVHQNVTLQNAGEVQVVWCSMMPAIEIGQFNIPRRRRPSSSSAGWITIDIKRNTRTSLDLQKDHFDIASCFEMGVVWCCHRGTSFPSSWNFGVVISWISSAEMLNGEMRFQGASRVVWGCWGLWIVWFCTTLHQVEDKCIFSKKKQLHFGTSDQHIVPVICHSQQFSPGKLFAFLCNWQVQKHLLAEILRRHQDSPYAFQNGLQGDAFDTFLPILATFCMVFGSLFVPCQEEWPLTTSSARATHWQSLGMTSMALWERSWVPMRWGLAECAEHVTMDSPDLDVFGQASKCFLQRGVLPAFAVLSYCFPSIVEDWGYCVWERFGREVVCLHHEMHTWHELTSCSNHRSVSCQLSVSTILFDHPLAFYLMHVGPLVFNVCPWKELQRMTVLPSTSDEPLVALLGNALRERLQWLGSFLCTSPMAAYDLKTEAQTYIEYLDMSSYLGMEGPYCHVWHVPFSLF